jgi:hypothetical protein
MNKLLRVSLFSLFSFVAVSLTAQRDWNYEWSQHNIVFTLANDFKVLTNTGDEFTAKGDGMEFGIFPFSDNTIDATDIALYTLAVAETLELQEYDDADVLDLNGLEGAYVEGYKDGLRIVLLGFIDPASATNFFAVITFSDDDENAADEAVRMILSFSKK